MFTHFITSFIAAAGFGVLFNAPRKALVPCGLIGMFGWLLFSFLGMQEMHTIAATTIAAILVGVLSQLSARMFKTPIIIFNVSGIIPLVPGGVAYDAMHHFVISDYHTAVELSARVMLLAGGIAIGLMFSEVANQIWRKMKKVA